MQAILQQQYNLLQGSRQAVFQFIETQVGPDLNTALPAFDGKTIRYLLVHTAGTYFHWLTWFALKTPVNFPADLDFTTIGKLRELYAGVDDAMGNFLKHFADKMEIPLSGALSRDRQVSATPLQLFTHVLTHEFHHKGQVMTMCRLLGHTPPDTDVIRF